MPAYIIAKSLHVHTVQYTTAPTSFPDSACISLGMRLQLYMFNYAGRQERVGKDYCLDVIQTNAGSLHPSCQPNSVHKDYGSQNGSVDRAS